MGQHIRWQAIIAFIGVALTIAFLSFVAISPRSDDIQTTTNQIVEDESGSYIEAIAGYPQFINPLLATYNQADQDLVALLFNGLVQSSNTGEFEPDLASSWDVSDDGLAYLFKLRQDVQWHDGMPFTANDVLFTVSILQYPDFPGAPYLSAIWQQVTAEKVDDYTVRFSLSEPLPTFLSGTTIGILPAHLLNGLTSSEFINHSFNQNPIGTGPFKLDTINAEFARLVPNPLYHGMSPQLKELTFRFYPTYQETLVAYDQEEVLGGAVPAIAMPLAQRLENLNIYNAQLSGYVLIYLNLQDTETVPFFQETELRQALMVGLNRQALVDTALHGQGVVAYGPILPSSWAYNPAVPSIDYNPDRANSLLNRLGWADSNEDGIRERDGQPLAFTLLTNDDPLKIDVAHQVSQQWQQFGIAATVEIATDDLAQRLTNHNFQTVLAELSFFGDPDPYPLWHSTQSEGGLNFGGWNHRQASILIEQARSFTDPGPRTDAYLEFQRIFADQLPALILYYPVFTYGVHQDVQGVQLSPLVSPSDRFRNIEEWYLATEETAEVTLGTEN